MRYVPPKPLFSQTKSAYAAVKQVFFYFYFFRTKVSQNAFNFSLNRILGLLCIFVLLIPYFEKILCSVAQEIRYILFIFTLFNVDGYGTCLVLLLLLLLLNFIPVAIF